MRLFVCAGNFCTNPNSFPPKYEFKLVRPSGNGSLPYVVKDDEMLAQQLFNLCQHHSHLYLADIDAKAFTLVMRGEPNSVQAPADIAMSYTLECELQQIVRATKFWMQEVSVEDLSRQS